MEGKKKRGCNYTAGDKEILLELINKYQSILENKETNAHMILKKRETWESVCQQYNAVAVSGSRTWLQLRHLYENLKQRSKKDIAQINRLQYYQNTTKELQKKASLDKKEINRTGGGSYKSSLSDQDAQILAMVAPQVQPLANPYDDAALYFGEIEEESIVIQAENIDNQQTMANINITKTDKPCTVTSDIADDQHNTMANIHNANNSKSCTVTSSIFGDQHTSTTMANINIEKNSKPCTVTSKIAAQMKPKQTKCSIKEQYFKTKLRNAKLETKFLINKNKMEINKYKIEIQILKLRLQKLKSQKKP